MDITIEIDGQTIPADHAVAEVRHLKDVIVNLQTRIDRLGARIDQAKEDGYRDPEERAADELAKAEADAKAKAAAELKAQEEATAAALEAEQKAQEDLKAKREEAKSDTSDKNE